MKIKLCKKLILGISATGLALALSGFTTLSTAATHPDNRSNLSPQALHQAITELQHEVDFLRQQRGSKHSAVHNKIYDKEYKKEQPYIQEGVSTRFKDHIVLSGAVNLQAAFSNKSSSGSFVKPSAEKMSLNTALINIHALLMPWLRSYVTLTYQPGQVSTNTGGQVNGPEFEQAYFQIANAKKSHFLLNVGKQFLPFGVYQRHPVINSFTQVLDETNKIALNLGATYKPFFFSIYGFSAQGGLSGVGNTPSNELLNGGVEIGAIRVNKHFGYDVSVGYINNLAEARFIYALIPRTNRRVSNIAAHVSFNIYHFDFIWDTSFPDKSFDPQDVTFNGVGAHPSAYEAEIAYHFPLMKNHPSTLAIAYQHSHEALFAGLPFFRYSASYTVYINRYLTGIIEYLRSRNYSSNDVATYNNNGTVTNVQGNTAWNNSVLLQTSIHF